MISWGILRYVARLVCRARAFHPLQSSKCVVLCENLNRHMKPSRLSLCLCLAFFALMPEPSAAMTMGRLRGASVLGQPLDVTVPLQLAGGEDVATLCAAADVYFGDSQVDPSQVAAHLGHFNGTTAVRVSVRRPVDEPVVTIYVKAGCQQQSVRKYVLLSEYSSETEHVDPPVVEVQVPKTIGRAQGSFVGANVNALPIMHDQPPVSQLEKFKTRSNGLPRSKVVAAQATESSEATSKVATNAPKGKVPLAGSARLKLLPLDFTQGWEPTLRATEELPPPSEMLDGRKRAEAAELWRVINASPEEILQEASRRVALEAELRSLVAASHVNQAAIAELSVQLKTAQEKRLFNPVVFSLLALLLGCGVFLGIVFHHRRRGLSIPPWWEGAEKGHNSEYMVLGYPSGRNPGPNTSGSESSRAPTESGPEFSVHAHIDIPLSDSAFPTQALGAHGNPEADQVGSGVADRPVDFAHSITGALRAINTQEMVDVRQQADFFLALGQHDDAVGVLYSALGQSTESNPYIYLDLIALLHKLSRKEEYEKIRQAFNSLYTGIVPVYGAYSASGFDLLDYPDLCLPLVQLWPTSAALAYIEQCLVRESTDAIDSGLGIEAFSDLLLLHGILRTVLSSAMSAPLPNNPIPKRALPLLPLSKPTSNGHGFPVARGYRVDLDLSANDEE